MKYYAVVDLEMCRVPKSMKSKYAPNQEIIQIGASLLNERFEPIDSYSQYVRPVYGYIDSFISHLTGIGRKQMDNALDLEEAVKQFAHWLPEGDITGVAWSNNDESQLRREMEAKGIRNPKVEALLDNWVDCQPMFARIMGNNRCYALSEALIASDIMTAGRQHDGLADAQNTALLFAKMKKEENFKLNDYYEKAHNEMFYEPLSTSLGDLFKGLHLDLVATA